MRMDVRDLRIRQLFQLRDAAYAGLILTPFAAPYWNRRSPEAITGNVPVACIGQPIPKAF